MKRIFMDSIRIGVTGHRILRAEDELKKQIVRVITSDVIKLFHDSMSRSDEVRAGTVTYTVVTPLAEGADRLVAETVLEYNSNSIIEVVLPLTLSDYRKTFRRPDDPGFTRLYNKANKIIPLRKLDFEDDPEIVNENLDIPIKKRIDEGRKKAFEAVGRYIVDHCDALIAIWNGQESESRGGTYDTIKYARLKKKPVITISSIAPHQIKVI